MKYVIAYDGGGTKTRMLVVDLKGTILFDKTTTGSNITSVGDTLFKEIISSLFIEAKQTLDITDNEISYIVLGLSGADLEDDYNRLYERCKPIFNTIPYKILNDAWIVLRSGLVKPYGAVAICGTGTNSAAINQDGKRAILRSLGYTLGIYGGGLDIAREALHYAFRADELTYKDTLLKEEIPKLFHVHTMDEVVPFFYPNYIVTKDQLGKITPLVNDCAERGDEIAQMILRNVATHIGYQTIGVLKQLQMKQETYPVVVGGRVFQLPKKHFLQFFIQTIKEYNHNAQIVLPRFAPVVGAYLMALDELDIPQSSEIESNLEKSGGLL